MTTTAPTATHYTIRGRKFVRVSEFLRAVGAASDFSRIPEKDRNFYLERGTANHDLWAKIEEGIDGQYTFDARVEVYRPAHALFLKETGFRALPGGIEKRVYATWDELGFVGPGHGDEAGIAGTLDRLGTFGRRVGLVDYKTSEVPASTAKQTATYLLALIARTVGYKFDEVERYGVAFRPNGKYAMSQPYPRTDYQETLGLVAKYLKEKS